MELTINGEARSVVAPMSVKQLLGNLGLDGRKVAGERNLEIVPRSTYEEVNLSDGDKLEIVHFIGGGLPEGSGKVPINDPFEVAGKTFNSRLIVGTGKYRDFEETAAAIEASGAEMVTVAVRRVNITAPSEPMLVEYVDPKKFVYLPNTAGCYNAEEAVRTLRLAREAGGWNLVKLEVLGDQKTLYPNMVETLTAAKLLLKE